MEHEPTTTDLQPEPPVTDEDTQVDPVAEAVCPDCGEPLEDGRWCFNQSCPAYIPF